MAGFPPLNLPPPSYSGGIPQYFSSSDPHSWYPGAPQYSMSMSRMLSDYGSLDPDVAALLGGIDKYGRLSQENILRQGRVGATRAMDTAAEKYNPTADASLKRGIQSGSDEPGLVEYTGTQLGNQAQKSVAQAQAAQEPGRMALMKQSLQNNYIRNKLQSLNQMIQLAANAGSANNAYQSAQLGADQGQIALANAQSRENAANLSSLMNFIMMGPAALLSPSTFYGPGSGGGGGGFGSTSSWQGLMNMLNPGADTGMGLDFAAAGSGDLASAGASAGGAGALLTTLGMM